MNPPTARPWGPDHQLLDRRQFDPQQRTDNRAHRDTICRLLVEVGNGCAALMDEQMRELPCPRIEVDEIWAYVGKKQRHMTALDDPRRLCGQYSFVALDPETKIVPAYRIGKRDLPTAKAFLADLSDRPANRVRSRPM